MHPSWQEFLRNQGAAFAPNGAASFNDTAPERLKTTHGLLCDLSHEGLIAVEGPDALTFLQGQLTQDLRKVSATYNPLAAYCSAKGRVLALLRLCRSPQGYWLRLPATCVETILNRLKMYTLRAQVSLRDARDELATLGIAGEKALTALRSWAGEPPQEADASRMIGGIQLIRLAGGALPRFLCLGEPSALAGVWQLLAAELRLAGSATWEWLEIQAGIPAIVPETSDKFVPQMLNLEKLGAISFTKGCYIGQEIIARSQYLGEVKRRLFSLHGEGEQPRPGDRVYGLAVAQDHVVGEIIRAAPAPTSGFAALAVLNNDAPRRLLLANDLPVLRN